MVSPKELAAIVQSSLLGTSGTSPTQRIELTHAIRNSFSSFQNLLSFPPPKASDRAQVQSREIRLPDSLPISLDDQDVAISLKLSDELHLNEIDSVRLLVSANQEWGLMGRDPLEIQRLAIGLWYTGRRDLTSTLYTLLRAVVMDHGVEPDLIADIQGLLEDLIKAGLRQRLIALIKELNREEPSGLGGPLCEQYLIDSRGALVERRAVVHRERLILGHCLVLSILVDRPGPKDVKDIYNVLKDNAAQLTQGNDTINYQINFSLLFSLIITFISDAISALSDKSSMISQDASFRTEFQNIVMASGSDLIADGFIGGIRLAWAVHLMLIYDGISGMDTISAASTTDMGYICSCLESIFSKNVFQFLLDNVLQTAAYQNDEEDMIYVYNAYLHKLTSCFLSHPIARDKVKESKDMAMSVLNSYRISDSLDGSMQTEEADRPLPFISLMEFVSNIYQKEPELLYGNDVLWTFVNFAGEDHTNFKTLVAFLEMLRTLASTQEGASKVYELLKGTAFRSIGWATLFDCIGIYDDKFKQSLQTSGTVMPDFLEGDAKALVAYLNVLQKVVENGNPTERKNWFPDIEPFFKLLGYENVPPYLKGALRKTIATFVHVFPEMRDSIWAFLEQYDLPVVVGSPVGKTDQSSQVYDMQFELNEIEARREQYPSTISFLNLINALIAGEKDVTDRGRRFIGIFRFVYDHVFAPFPQRAYSDPCEKWQLVVACLQHFHMILSMYDIQEEDLDGFTEHSQFLVSAETSSLQTQLPVIELLKDFMSGKTLYRNLMSVLQVGVNSIMSERMSKTYGKILEKAVQLSLEILLLVFDKDLLVSDVWRPLYQPLDIILSQDHNQIVALLEYVRYDSLPQIQRSSIKLMNILSSRLVGLVPMLIKMNAANSLIEDYASCLELRLEEGEVVENSCDDLGVLIMQLLVDCINRPAPNITHLLLKFDLDAPVEGTVLQPKFHYSCLKVILEMLEKLPNPDINFLLFECGFQLLCELSLDPLTSGPIMDLLSSKKYQFFLRHLDTIGVATLPKRSGSQTLRISSLHQRAWLLKLLAIALHNGSGSSSDHLEACQSILSHLFGREVTEAGNELYSSTTYPLQDGLDYAGTSSISKSKVLALLEILQFRSPDASMQLPQIVSSRQYDTLVEEILGNRDPSVSGSIYYYSERGDRLIDLSSFSNKLYQKLHSGFPLVDSFQNVAEVNEVRETIQQLLKWGWKYNRNLEEQAAQLHMLAGWSQIVEISACRRISSLDNRSEILYRILDASLSASASPDCSLKMAFVLTQVALTCIAKLRDDRFLFHGALSSDTVTCLDVMMVKHLSTGACHSLLLKLVMAILRHESSESLRRRQYALLLSYFQYCQHMIALEVPTSVVQFLLLSDQDDADLDIQKIDKEQADLARANFAIIKKEAQGILDLVIKDACQGSEFGKTISLYVLEALVCIDHERYFLSQLQSRGFIRSCLGSISNISHQAQDGRHLLESQQRACTLEAEFALLLRISHKYGKSGGQVLFSMGALEHIASCRATNFKGNMRRVNMKLQTDTGYDVQKQRTIITAVLRLVFALTSLVETSEFVEGRNKIVREVIEFIKGHQLLFDQLLREDVTQADDLLMEQIILAVGILSKVWPFEENDEYGVVQGMFDLMSKLFTPSREGQVVQGSELKLSQLRFSLTSFLYFLVTKSSLRLQISNDSCDNSAKLRQPTLMLLASLLSHVTDSLEGAAEKKSLLLHKIRDINEVSRQDVDAIIKMCDCQEYVTAADNIHKRRYIAMVEMCKIVGSRDQLITLLLQLTEHVLNIILIHLQDRSGSSNEWASSYGSKSHQQQEVADLCGKLSPIIERLALLNEGKVGHNLKVFKRLANTVKEMAVQKCL
ncbi:nuclear pore complex protein NUP205 isoform X2 [Brassica napus]|uniref:nuclear pore complex protein NUP205 isoform X2 n=1 Tax=Brassica oleracea var. oleracea TaxID=109376 RepID=UPI0006A72C1D|nr:PREDICTED: nuclear pore complex protein NUP205 isoform X2 [Brassica oleracea var. oleracea]XP_048618485.1 nuclear pore complex protein NUP205 isoform X2 [Brassica napus]